MSCSKIMQMEDPWSWSNLPVELTGLILCCLPAHIDRLRFAAVCRNWHFSSRQHGLSPPLPWLALADGTFFSLPHSESFQFLDSSGYHSCCSGEWLVFLRNGACSLVNPFTKVTLILPNVSYFRSINEPGEIVNGPRVQELNMSALLLNMIHGISIWKVTMCSPLLVAAIFVIGDIHTIGFCRPGASSWFMSKLGNGKSIMDIAFYEGRLYAVAVHSKELFAVDIEVDNDTGEQRVSRIERVIEGPPFSFTMGAKPLQFLVESGGALLLVRREAHWKESYPSETDKKRVVVLDVKFLVFEADLQSSQWVEVKSVGDDIALFMGRGCSGSVCVSQYKPWRNCIFFLDDGTWNWLCKEEQWSCYMYNMRDEELYSPPKAAWMSKQGPGGAWLFPQL